MMNPQRLLHWSLLILLLASVSALPGRAQQNTHMKLEAQLQPADARAGEGAQVVIKATIEPSYHIYSLTQPKGGPMGTTIELKPGGALIAAGKAVQPPFKAGYDPNFEVKTEEYEQGVSFGVPVTLKPGISGAQKAAVSVHFQICNQRGCLNPPPVDVPVAFTVAQGAARPDRAAAIIAVPPQDFSQATGEAATSKPTTTGESAPSPASKDATKDRIQQAQNRGLLSFIGLAIGAGF